MAARSHASGICALCEEQASKDKMLAHLETCIPEQSDSDRSRSTVLLHFEAEGEPAYWLVIAASATATLRHIDALLRDVWLECCGHMSAFYGPQREIPMRATVGDTFRRRTAKVRHEYDFGSTTTLVGKSLGTRRGFPGRGPVRLLARNEPLHWSCAECDKPAAVVCPYCLDVDGLYCDAHAATHEHAEEEAYLPVVNSPRMGVCGYTA